MEPPRVGKQEQVYRAVAAGSATMYDVAAVTGLPEKICAGHLSNLSGRSGRLEVYERRRFRDTGQFVNLYRVRTGNGLPRRTRGRADALTPAPERHEPSAPSPTLINRENIIALLEGGEMGSGDLAKLLGPTEYSRINSTLRQLAREGVVTTVGPAKKWALVPIANVQPELKAVPTHEKSTSVPSAPSPESQAPRPKPTADDDELLDDEELLEDDGEGLDEIAYEADVAPERRAGPGRQSLRQVPPATVTRDAPSWWVSASPAGFTAQAEQHLDRMAVSKEGRRATYRHIVDE